MAIARGALGEVALVESKPARAKHVHAALATGLACAPTSGAVATDRQTIARNPRHARPIGGA